MGVYRHQEEDEGLYPPSGVRLSHLTPTLGHLLDFADKISVCCFFNLLGCTAWFTPPGIEPRPLALEASCPVWSCNH